jgi:hypothetical protein
MISSPARFEAECGTNRGGEDTLSFPAEQVAVHYIDDQLEKARRSLRRTRAFCLVILFSVLGYMSFVTVAFRNRLLRPEAAAEMAAYYFSKFAYQNSQIPLANVGEPVQGSATSDSSDLTTKSIGNSVRAITGEDLAANGDPLGVEAQVAAYVRGFVFQPHGNLQSLIREAQHPKTVQQLSDQLDQEMRERLPSRVRYGLPDPDYMSYVDQKLATLVELESQFDRLAHADDLTPHEKAIRHILAAIMASARQGS